MLENSLVPHARTRTCYLPLTRRLLILMSFCGVVWSERRDLNPTIYVGNVESRPTGTRLVVRLGFEPNSSRVSGGCLHRLSYRTLVEDRGNAPRIQSPCKGNQLTLEHPPKLVPPLGFEPRTLTKLSYSPSVAIRMGLEPTPS